MLLTNKQIMDYFGWKNICEGETGNPNCRYPHIHTHEISDIDNEFRRSLNFEKMLQCKCDCGDSINENNFKLSYESWGASLGENETVFNITFICSKCRSHCGANRIISHNDIINHHIVDINKTI